MNTHHRKLFSETALCDHFCDPTQNPTGCCPVDCVASCPSACFNPPPLVTISTVQHYHRSHKLQQSIIISTSLIGLSCLIYCIFTLYKLFRNRRRRVRDPQQTRDRDDEFLDEEHGPVPDHPIWYIRTIGLEPSTIDLITAVKYKSGEGLVEGTECSVCLSEFEDDETLRLLPKCNHAFHLPCIDTWLRSHTNCPLCRAPIVSNPNGTLSPILEQSFEGDSVVVEDSQVAISEGSEVRERENRDSEMKGVESSQQGRGDSENVEIDEVQPMRRSVSMDSLASLRLRSDIANAQFGEPSEINAGIVPKRMDLNQGLKRFVGGSSFRRSLQKGPVLIKRSSSCSGKVLFPSHNQNSNSVLPLRTTFSNSIIG